MVSPDSGGGIVVSFDLRLKKIEAINGGVRAGDKPTKSTIPSATPSAQAASTLPPTYIMFVFNFLFPSSFPPSPTSSSSARKYLSVTPVKLVTTFRPTNSLGSVMPPFSGTCTCSLHLPNPRSSTSSTPLPFTPPCLPPSSLATLLLSLASVSVCSSPRFASCSST